MPIHEVFRRAALLRAKRLYGADAAERRLPAFIPLRPTFRQRLIDLAIRPVLWLQAGVLELLRWVDRRGAGPVRVKLPRPPGSEFLVIGHRGSPLRHVENTLPSLDAAIEKDGANAVEVDLVLTRDGEVAAYHDWDPDEFVAFARQQGAEPGQKFVPIAPPAGSPWRRPVVDLTLEELRRCYGFRRRMRRRPARAWIPTIGEVFAWSSTKPALRALLLDVKIPPGQEHLVPRMAARIREARAAHPQHARLIVLCPVPSLVRAFLAESPEWECSLDVALPAGIVRNPAAFSAVRSARELGNACASLGRPPMTFGGWRIFRAIVESDMSSTVEPSLPPIRTFLAWTINARSEMRQLCDIGVHGILTDRPRILARLARRRGIP